MGGEKNIFMSDFLTNATSHTSETFCFHTTMSQHWDLSPSIFMTHKGSLRILNFTSVNPFFQASIIGRKHRDSIISHSRESSPKFTKSEDHLFSSFRLLIIKQDNWQITVMNNCWRKLRVKHENRNLVYGLTH